uniref:Uncharacterized protein n=1 Tax=Strombidinopsis acuminata TaxID=141414 RepID=A0A7S3TB17_9SPIT|mmetsp:Transcript_58782/g.80757  ORF Transcript_58782/g.80757 Transcript_58782/m.80757 type:complete len:102 (+) Transcript_58782:2-307(+)
MHFHGWGLGLKTGMYYLRTKAAADAIQFTVEVDKVRRSQTMPNVAAAASAPSAAGSAAKGGYPAAAAADGAAAAPGADAMQAAIDRLKAAEPTNACLNCSA